MKKTQLSTMLSAGIILLVSLNVCGQDRLITKSGEALDVRIIEKNRSGVTYKMAGYPDGPLITVRPGAVDRIEYRNGAVDLMGNQNPRKEKPFGISMGGVTWPFAGGLISTYTMDYFITPQVSAEINAGNDLQQVLYFSAGVRAHVNSGWSVRRLTPFAGALFGYEYGNEFVQIPLGVNYMHRTGINVSLSVNELIFSNSSQTTVELRGGWRFKL
ncbi:MAG: hypothetical protein LBV26_02025 [Bacteroidales bacterium]|nr:hypothetical protein [Bacteroidales bacterium]